MTHASVAQLLAGDPAAIDHARECALCRSLTAVAQPITRTSPSEPDHDELPIIDRALYTAWRPLEGGGMGRTSIARDRRLGRAVAIKEIREDAAAADRAALARRLEQEARLTSRLQHPSIVGVHEAGRWQTGEPYYAMPLVRGRPLDVEIAARATERDRLALLPHVIAASEAVAYAHGEGVVHRDLKPSNMMIGEYGETVVIDWGLAKAVGDSSPEPSGSAPRDGLTRMGVGTPQYMPPEQAQGTEPGARVDVYALGATLYHVLSGKPPYGNAEGARARLLAGPPKPLAEASPNAPPELVAIVEKAMARDPAARFATARELAAELQRFHTGQLTLTHHYTLAELARRFARKHRAALAVAGAGLLALIIAAAFGARRIAFERDRATDAQLRAEAREREALERLAIARGVAASRMAQTGARRLEALGLAVQAVTPALSAHAAPPAEAAQGLFDALDAGRAVLVTAGAGATTPSAASGMLLATVGLDHELRIYDLRDGHLVMHVATGMTLPWRPYFSPDGTRVLVCGYGDDRGSALVDLATLRVAHIGSNRQAEACGFLPDGSAVTASDAIEIWPPGATTPSVRHVLGVVGSALAVTPAGAIAVGDSNGGVTMWDPHTDRARRVAASHREISGVAAAPDGSVIASTWDGEIERWDHPLDGGAPVAIARVPGLKITVLSVAAEYAVGAGAFHAGYSAPHTVTAPLAGGEVRELDLGAYAVTGDGELLGWDTADNIVRVSPATGGLLEAIPATGHVQNVLSAADRIATVDRNGAVWLFDGRVGTATGIWIGHTGEVTAAATSPDGLRLATASLDGSVRIWRVASATAVAVHLAAPALSVAWSSDGSSLVTVDAAGAVRVIGVDGATRAAIDDTDAAVAAFSPDGARLAIGRRTGAVELHDPRTGAQLARCDGTAGITALAWAADGSLIAADRAGEVRRWSPTCERLADLPDDRPSDHDGVTMLAIAGDLVAVARPAGRTIVARVTDLSRVREIAGVGHTAVAGGQIVVSDANGATRIVDLATGVAAPVDGHERAITATASAPGMFATGDEDGKIVVSDARTGAMLRMVVPNGLGPVTALAFGGGNVIAGYQGGSVRAYAIGIDDALARACATLASFARPCPR